MAPGPRVSAGRVAWRGRGWATRHAETKMTLVVRAIIVFAFARDKDDPEARHLNLRVKLARLWTTERTVAPGHGLVPYQLQLRVGRANAAGEIFPHSRQEIGWRLASRRRNRLRGTLGQAL